jgi:exopolysaccharide biosynthesis polyprenyl glycosylphosphotransferase
VTTLGTFVRRNFEPIVLSVQVVLDLAVVLLACWLGYQIGERLGGLSGDQALLPYQRELYRELSALIAAVCLVTFHAFGLYSPVKSLLNMEEYKGILKSTLVAFLVLLLLLVYLRSAREETEGAVYRLLGPLHDLINLRINVTTISRATLLVIFALVLVGMTASRFASFKVIQRLHQEGIGNRNVLIYGAGETGRHLQRKFRLVPTLGLNLVGYCDDDRSRVGMHVDRARVLGGFEDLERVIGEHKVSEVFLAIPEAQEERVMAVLVELERLGVTCHIVPRLYHLMSFNLRMVNVDSIPLFTRAVRRPSFFTHASKRALDLVVASLVLIFAFPVLVMIAILIRRESPGPVFFVQERIGRDGRPFRMYKFRTMHHHLSGDAPTPRSHDDPRITAIGRWLRRFSLDELPQFLNVLGGSMSVVGPRPEMRFIVEQYGPLDRERLRVKPGITGLWQISYARELAIHQNLDYDLYYIEHQSLLLDLVIIALTGFAVVKGTGAY